MADWNAGQALCRWTVVAVVVSLLGFSLPDSARCGLLTKEEKLTYKKNKEAMDKAPVRRGGKWRSFTRLVRPGEDPAKVGLKKGTYVQSGHQMGRPSLDKYKKDNGIAQNRKGYRRVEGYYKPSAYKQSDIKGAGSKSYKRQEMPTKNVSAKDLVVTRRVKMK